MSERPLDADVLKEIHEYGINVDADLIYLDGGEADDDDGEITIKVARKFRKNLRIVEDAAGGLPDYPATVEINTPGGCVTSGLSIFDAVRRCKKLKLTGLVTGEVSSMGCVILQAFKDRALEPNATLMYHAGCTGMDKPSQEFPNASAAEVAVGRKVDNLVYARVLEKQPSLTRDAFDIAVMRGLYFSDPQAAIDYGLADRIAD